MAKIIDSRNLCTIPLRMVVEGDIFVYNDNFFIKTDYYNESDGNCLCVNVDSGGTIFLSEDAFISNCNATVVIEDSED